MHVTLPAVGPHTLAFPYNVSGGLLFGKHRVSHEGDRLGDWQHRRCCF